jgi:hypothetical protein
MGSMNKYRGIDGKDVARAMHNAAKQDAGKVTIYEWEGMTALGKSQEPRAKNQDSKAI